MSDVDIERKAIAALLKHEDLWKVAAGLNPACFTGHRGLLFKFMKSHFDRFDSLIPKKALGKALKRNGTASDEQKGVATEFFSCRRERAGGEWEIEELVESYRKIHLLEQLTGALEAIRGSVTVKGKSYSGIDGACKLLGIYSDLQSTEDAFVDPFIAYERRKTDSGIVKLDLFDGVFPDPQMGELWLICGFPGEGKTTMALNLALDAMKKGEGVVIITMEAPRHVVYWKLASMLSAVENPRIAYREIKTASLDEAREVHFRGLLDKVKAIKVIGSSVGTGPRRIRQICKQVARDQDIGLVIVDYLGLMVAKSGMDDTLGPCVTMMKGLAMEFNAVVVLLHQTNRTGWSIAQKLGYYTLGALAETNRAERDSDAILWVLKTAFLRSKMGMMKYRDEPIDIGSGHDLYVDKDLSIFNRVQGGEGEGASAGQTDWEGELPIDDI